MILTTKNTRRSPTPAVERFYQAMYRYAYNLSGYMHIASGMVIVRHKYVATHL